MQGSLSPENLGITHPHEHVFLDLTVWLDKKAPKKLLHAPLSLDILADLRRKDGQNLDNMLLDSFDDAVSELLRFKNAGGRSIVDVSPIGTGRDPQKLLQISRTTGLNIICGTGYYAAAAHPAIVKKKSVEDLAEIMVSELEDGIDGTAIRAGVIGEIGCSEPLHLREAKVIAAAARAQARTRAGLTLHTALFDVKHKRAPKQVRQEVAILQKKDADLSKVYISHMDFTYDDPKYQQELMDEFGVTLSYDCFGQEQYYDNIYFGAGGMTDRDRCSAIANHIKNGYARQLLMSCDICEKFHLRKYGGYGYANILENVVPSLKLLGVSEREIRTIMVENPARILSR